jgi:hypothetical protein
MKTFKQFCEQVNRPVNARQAIPLDNRTQNALNAARSVKPGGKKPTPVTFSLQTVQQLK